MAESRKSNIPHVRQPSSESDTVPHSSTFQPSGPSSTTLPYSRLSPLSQEVDSSTLSRLATPSLSATSSTTSCLYDPPLSVSMMACGPYDPKTPSCQPNTRSKLQQQGQVLVYESGKKFYPHPRGSPVHLTPYECFINKTGTPISCQFLPPSSPAERVCLVPYQDMTLIVAKAHTFPLLPITSRPKAHNDLLRIYPVEWLFSIRTYLDVSFIWLIYSLYMHRFSRFSRITFSLASAFSESFFCTSSNAPVSSFLENLIPYTHAVIVKPIRSRLPMTTSQFVGTGGSVHPTGFLAASYISVHFCSWLE